MTKPLLLVEARALLGRGVLLHASAVAFADGCRLFLAPSGGGKTTISLMLEEAGGLAIGSDTTLVCRGTDSVLRAMSCASFAPARIGRPPATRLSKLVILEKGPLLRPIELDPGYAAWRLFRQGQIMILDSLDPPERELASACLHEIICECGCEMLRFDAADPPGAVRDALLAGPARRPGRA